ncbi:MAG TPA: sensor histidine kinase [Candidatus Wirthbacteria bacterium]|nr:sensor histidine kinase [Candidatus Wirthbacteria bacterium]
MLILKIFAKKSSPTARIPHICLLSEAEDTNSMKISFKPFSANISSRITLAITLTVFLALGLVGLFSFTRINQGFDIFLERQRYGRGLMRNQLDQTQTEHEAEIINQFKQTLTNSLLLASGGSAILALSIGYLVSRQIASPLNKLQQTILKIKQNNYQIRATEFGPADIQNLIREFNSLIQELQRLENLREELVSNIAHELKTPLTKIKGRLEGIQDGVYQPDPTHLNTVIQNVDQLEFLINQLQDLSQLKAGKINLQIQPVNLAKLINKVTAGYDQTQTSIQIEVDQNLVIQADEQRLISIMDNLISNALKANPQTGLTIKADQQKLAIQDTGHGIPPEDLPFIFERFYRVDKSRSRQNGGMGLGLAIVKETVQAHGWRIVVASQADQGTTFTIFFAA